jgi:hypothetical protein
MFTRRQHYVPCAYLQFFDALGAPRGRESEVYVSSRDGHSRLTRVAKVGFQNWTYSRARSHEAEALFQKLERDYPDFARRMIADMDPGPVRGHLISTLMLDMHLRSPAYENRTAKERISMYPVITKALIGQLVAPGEDLDMRAAGMRLRQEWQVTAIKADNETFFTSDSPTLIFSNSTQSLAIAMPISPQIYALTYNSRHLDLVHTSATDADVGLLNGLQVRYCMRDVFSHEPLLDTADWDTLQSVIERKRPERWIDHDHIRPNFIDPNLVLRFSFLRYRVRQLA